MSEVVGLEQLQTLVRESAGSGVERQALLLRLDVLPPSLSRPSQLRRARAALNPLTLADRGRCHEMPSGRIVVSWRGDAPNLLRQTMDALDLLLQDDPFEAPGIHQLVERFELPGDGAELLQEAGRRLAARPAASSGPADAPVFDKPSAPQPLDAASLDRLEQSLASADMSRFARRRSICHTSSQRMQLAWDERTLSIAELIETVAPGRDAKADAWLFRRLTRVLDRRMLSILSDPKEVRGAGPFGITLNVASMLGPEFLRFDSGLPPALRDRVVISLLPADVASDASAFAFARNFARSRSYRICLRAVSASLLPLLDLPALELDYVQLVWSDELAAMKRLPPTGGARWIMGRPCTGEAIEWGIRAGIGLFSTTPTPQ